MDTYWTLLQKCNDLEIFSCEIESQSERVDSVRSLPENKILELSVKSNILMEILYTNIVMEILYAQLAAHLV